MSTKEENSKLNFELGNRVKLLREKLNLSRKTLAELIEISDYFLVEIETGRKGVSNVTLCKLAKALYTTTDYLLTGKDKYSDTGNITSMLSTADASVVEGAENILKAYLLAINRTEYEKNKNDQL